jgi:hypothetical protein
LLSLLYLEKNNYKKIKYIADLGSKKFDTQTCENYSFVSEIHTHACWFLNKFLQKYAHFFRTHARVWFQYAGVWIARRVVISTRLIVVFTRRSVILTRSNVISTRRVRFVHEKCDFNTHKCNSTLVTHECDLDTQTYYYDKGFDKKIFKIQFVLKCIRL